MSIIETIKNLFTNAHSRLPEELNSVEEVKAKAADLAGQHGETFDKGAEALKERIPGETDDKIIGAAQTQVDNLAANDAPAQPTQSDQKPQ